MGMGRSLAPRLALCLMLGATSLVAMGGSAGAGPGRSNAPDDGLVRGGIGSPCDGLFEIRSGDRLLGCTHGPDPAPPGLGTADRGTYASLVSQLPVASAANVPCVGTGTDGKRVQAIYARPSDVADAFAATAPLIRQWVLGVNNVFNASAGETAGKRQVRFVTSAPSGGTCQVDVDNVVLNVDADDNFSNTITRLRAAGYTSSSRKFMVFMDDGVGNNNDSVGCGIGELYPDDRSDPAQNYNNGVAGVQGMFSRTDRNCWGHLSGFDIAVESHELMHNLGAVQGDPSVDPAPNYSGYGHCTDDYDAMCYVDGPGVVMEQLCNYLHEPLMDCRHDDYFSTAPPAGSYLATHWNTASSGFLASTLAPPNDAFAKATVLTGAQRELSSAIGATVEAAEPTTAGITPSRSLWYSITVPSGQALTLDTQGSGFDTVLGVYTGSSVGSLSLVGENDNALTGVTFSRVVVNPTTATTYRIKVDYKAGKAGAVSLNVGYADDQTPTGVITSVTPAAATVGQQVNVNGSNLLVSGEYFSLYFNGVSVTPANIVSYFPLVIKVPNGAVTGPITISTPRGISISPKAVKVKPQITGFNPASGAVGTNVAINGVALTGATKVTFNGVVAPAFTVTGYGTITVRVPGGATDGRIKVTTPGGVATSGTDFNVT